MEEIPAGRVYCLNLDNGKLSFKCIPKNNSKFGENTLNVTNETNATNAMIDTYENDNENEPSSTKSMNIEQSSERLHQHLDRAVRRRVIDAPTIPVMGNTTSSLTSSPPTTTLDSSTSGNHDDIEASVAILFSGGVDSVVLAALCDNHVPKTQPIDLINVAFANTKAQNKKGNNNNNNSSTNNRANKQISDETNESVDDAAFEASPDRQAALLSYQEMKIHWPNRKWRFIAVNVDYDEVLKYEETICGLISPLSSTMDFNIGTAFWFASRGRGLEREIVTTATALDDMNGMKRSNELRFSDNVTKVKEKVQCSMRNCKKIAQPGCVFRACKLCCSRYQRPISQYLGGRASLCPVHSVTKTKKKSKQKGNNVTNNVSKQSKQNSKCKKSSKTVTSNAKVILIGIGADEQMAGYGRHRTAYNRGGYDALRKELAMEKDRLWTRNLGRDDRCISYHGKEARFPFLDEDVVGYLNSLDVIQLCDMTKLAGEGDKMILRLIAKKIGVCQCSGLVKRAIQFGSRIAKVSDTHRFGSTNKAKGTASHR
jgi:asparagine synthetase B (glutamine-hydrolysing)